MMFDIQQSFTPSSPLPPEEVTEAQNDLATVQQHEKLCQEAFMKAVHMQGPLRDEKTKILQEISEKGETAKNKKKLKDIEEKQVELRKYIDDTAKQRTEAKQYVEFLQEKLGRHFDALERRKKLEAQHVVGCYKFQIFT